MFVFRHQVGRAALRSFADPARNGREEVIGAAVKNLLCGVKPEAVEVKFINPITWRSCDEKFADRAGIGAIEIKRLPHSFL